jgi:Zn-dependent peptidase ImmA (M78 family)
LFRRGFKSQCERNAVEVRRSFSLLPDAPLSAKDYASKSGIRVWSDRDIDELPDLDRLQLTVNDPDSWSAFVIRIDQKHLILYNSAQSEPRVNSVVMHELSHILLGHELSSAGLSEDGHLLPTIYNQDQEDEANWLAGTLLLPRPALVKMRLRGVSEPQAMQMYGVSEQMLKWRIRMTGVDYQLARV